jgi:hypothetical protein
MNPYTALMLWLGTWNLEASRFWIELADRIEGDGQ